MAQYPNAMGRAELPTLALAKEQMDYFILDEMVLLIRGTSGYIQLILILK